MLTAVGHDARNGDNRGDTGEYNSGDSGDTAGVGKPIGHSGLVGAGASRVGISGAMRARDVSRVRPEDLAEAERDVRIRHAAPTTGHAPAGSASPATRPAPPKPGAPVPAPPPRRDHHAGGT